ncbi:protein disulfide-isomerase domain [Verruconis gallopava]|uniref:protein disulfide-isomerase n=1 Tax=Verruconis gallopava TaxID=253628 RepID=A0A0D2A4E1_9PEZI|nr:protein disulfide-isomerase domain [Verruconis gallopava]KIW01653.1 protein disulfide-isomerase domain [Verruconis gallopava]
MRIPALFASLAIGTTAASAVLDLIPDNFDKVVLKSGKPALVEFFAPWCGHCKNLAPVYEELATAFEFAKDKVSIAKVDADAQKELGRRFGIQGFPTLKWFDGKSDTPEDYKGGRDLDSLSAFITEKTGIRPRGAVKPPSEVKMLNDKKFNETVGKDKNVFVAFTAPWCGHCKTLAPIWEQLATDFVSEDSVIIAKVDAESPDSKRVAQEQGVTSYPTIKWFPAGKTEAEKYSGARTEAAFIDFINKEAGTYRAPGGGLTAAGGTIAAVDTVIQKIVDGGNTVAEKADEIAKAAKAAAGEKYAEYYGKVAGKIKANEGYLDKELSRLEGIIKKGGLAPQKLDDLVSRSNILRRFKVAKTETTDEKEEL